MMNTDKIISLCNQIELIIGAICNTGYTIQLGDEEAIFNRTKAIADEVNAPPKSNADFIRHMTDEELADWFAQFMMCCVCDKENKPVGCNKDECRKYALKYMKKGVNTNDDKG